MVAQILAAFQLLTQIVEGIKFIAKFIQDNRTEAWFQESAKLFTDLRAADTEEKKRNAARRLRDLINSI